MTRARNILLYLIVASFLGTGLGAQTTWHVEVGGSGNGTLASPYGSIQVAISNAVSGDTILVGPGTYAERLNLQGKDVLISGRDGADATVVDGQGLGTTVKVVNGETTQAILEGLTITNGSGAPFVGGGIHVLNSSLTLRHCRISNNVAQGGAGMLVDQTSEFVVVFNCIFEGNQASAAGGACISGYNSSMSIQHSLFTGNTASGGVSGLFRTISSNFDIRSSILWNNYSSQAWFDAGCLLHYCYVPQTFGFSLASTNLIGVQPGFVDAFGLNGPVDYRLDPSSPLVNAGPLTYQIGAPTIVWQDWDGNRRMQGRADIGPFERPYTPKTIEVPVDYSTLQAAMYAAWAGDTVLVAPGSYEGFFWPYDKTVILRSSGGAANTFIDGGLSSGGPEPAITMIPIPYVPPIGRDCIIEGFTFRNCSASPNEMQAAIRISNSSPTIDRCRFRDNDNGAIEIFASSRDADPLIRSCEFFDNTNTSNATSASVITVFDANSSATGEARATIEGCTIADNTSGAGIAGVVSARSGAVTIINSILWNNQPAALDDPSALIAMSYSDCQTLEPGPGNIATDPQFIAPMSDQYGLAPTSPCIDAGDASSPTLGSLDFEGEQRLACLSIDMGADEILPVTNCTILVGPGGYLSIQQGINAAQDGDTVLVAPGTYHETIRFHGKEITLVGSGTSGAQATIIEPDYDGDGQGDFPAVFFMDGETSTTVMRDLRITKGVNRQIAYDPLFPTFSLPTSVISGILSALGTEKPPTPNGGGVICYNASPLIEDCLIDGCTTEDTLTLVAIGSSTGSGGGVAVVAEDGGNASPILRGCTIRDNTTGHGWSLVLNVDSGHGAGVYCVAEDENSTAMVTLEDCQILNNGCGFSDDDPGSGGGIYVRGTPGEANAGLVMTGCTVSNNAAGLYNGAFGTGGSGGGIYLQDVMASTLIEDSVIDSNQAGGSSRSGLQTNFNFGDPPVAADVHSGTGGSGGGLVLHGGASAVASFRIANCIISRNEAGTSYASLTPAHIGVEQVNNGGAGGAIQIITPSDQQATVDLVNCIIVGNASGSSVGNGNVFDQAGNGGAIIAGAALQADLILNVESCTIADNSCGTPQGFYGGYGPGFHLAASLGADVQVTCSNSILYHHLGNPFFTNVDAYSAITTTMNHCNVEGGFTGQGFGNIAVDPGFVNRGLDYHLAATSLCIDQGDAAALGGTTTDFEGDARVIGSAPDIGADESLAGGAPATQPWPGSQDDFLLLTRVNGLGIPIAARKTLQPGDELGVVLLTPGGSFIGGYWILGAAVFQPGFPPPPTPGNPDVHILNGGFVLAETGTLIGSVYLPATGVQFPGYAMPPWLVGQNVLLQGFVFSPLAANGVYAATNGHEIEVR